MTPSSSVARLVDAIAVDEQVVRDRRQLRLVEVRPGRRQRGIGVIGQRVGRAAGEQRVEPDHRQRHPVRRQRRVPLARGQFVDPPASLDRGLERRAQLARDLDLDAQPQVGVGIGAARERVLELGDALGAAAVERIGRPQRDARAQPLVRVGRQLDRLGQMLARSGRAAHGLGQPELHHDRGARIAGRAFAEGPLQIDGRDVGSPAPARLARGGAQHLDGGGRRGRLGQQQLRGDDVVRRAGGEQDRRRLGVRRGALAGRVQLVDGGPHDRVLELDPHARLEDPDRAQLVPGRDGALGRQPGELGDGALGGALAEHGGRTRERPGVVAEPAQAREHGAAHGLRPEPLHLGGPVGRRLQAALADLAQQRAQVEGVAAARRITGVGEGVVDRPVRHGVRELGRGGPRQRPRADDRDRVVGGQHVVLLDRPPLDPRPRADDHHGRERVDPVSQKRDEAQRRQVRPVRVVDGDQQRPVAGQPRREDVERVQHVVVGVAVDRRAVRDREDGPRGSGGAPEQALTVSRRGRLQHRLEQLADHAESEIALQLGAARRERPRAGCVRLRELGGSAHLLQERRLADAGDPLDEDRSTCARLRIGDCAPKQSQFVLALERPPDHTSDSNAPRPPGPSDDRLR